MWLALGAGVGVRACSSLGWGAILAHHIVHLDRLDALGRGRLRRRRARGPRRGGARSPRSTAACAQARAHERDLAHTIERFQSAAEAIPDGMVVLDAQNRIKWANARAQALLGLDLAQDTGAPLVNLVRQPEFVRYLEAGDYRDAVVIDSQRDSASRSRSRSCRSASPRSS